MVSNGKIPSVLFHLEMARIVFQLHREIFSPRGKKKRRRRKKKKKKKTIYISRVRCVTSRVYDILFHTHLGNGNRSGCYTQNSHVFIAKYRVRLFFIACTLVHLIRETDRGCGKRK